MAIPEQIAPAAIIYFGQVIIFCWFISKNMFVWFLLMIQNFSGQSEKSNRPVFVNMNVLIVINWWR